MTKKEDLKLIVDKCFELAAKQIEKKGYCKVEFSSKAYFTPSQEEDSIIEIFIGCKEK